MASKFGLGRGLADIQAGMGELPDISILTGGERVVIKQIPLAQIGANPDQPRKTFRDAELNDLAASIKEKGVLQPILLRAVQNQPYNYEIVAGERRFRASKMAGLTEIPAVVKKLDDHNAMEIALIENVQRENLDPVEEGAAYKNLIEKCNYDMADVSRLIGKSTSYIRNSMRILDLPESVRKMVADGEISASHARTIAVADNPIKLAREIVENKLSVADAGTLVKNSKRAGKSRQFTSKTIAVADIKKMENDIQKSLKVPAKITERRGGAGQITLKFNNRLEMNELIEKLKKC
ncbi:MAG: ParB/RepB/Spo0J family partition protein [Alphaproteobacteria bacterium]|nr:ParB/RepB/Spo0J family partition protein [Alphaproteobacteria bacterium]